MKLGLVLACCVWVCAFVSPAYASGSGAWWHVDLGSRPASIPAGGVGEIVVMVENVGVAQASGSIGVADVLPVGWHALGIVGSEPLRGGMSGETVAIACSVERLSCEAPGVISPFDVIEVRIEVEAPGSAQSGEESTVTVTGGGAPASEIMRGVSVGPAGGFGVQRYGLAVEAEGGGPVMQAAGHPFQVTGSILLDQGSDAALSSLAGPPSLVGLPSAGPVVPLRDVVARLPPGFVANPSAVARCQSWQFTANLGGEHNECPYQSAIGVASITFERDAVTRTVAAPIFNIEPEPGEPARFGFYVPVEGVPVALTTSVRSEEDWGVNLSASEVPQSAGISSVRVTFWGVPASALHDNARGWGCLAEAREHKNIYEGCVHLEEKEPPAFVTLPTSCTSPLTTSIEADSWSMSGVFQDWGVSEPLAPLTGCANVPFSPTISTATTTGSASSPSGFAFDLTYNRSALTNGASIAQSNLKDTVVSLPEGLTIDPSAGVGLGACTPGQFAEVTPNSSPEAGCPVDSKLGSVEIQTPLLFTTIEGSLYLAQPYENPFDSLIAVYVIARTRAQRGILVKLAGRVTPDPVTGRLTVTFENDPPLQFERFNFHFREGAQAPLISPATCGTYTTTALLTPYATPQDPLTDTASFQVTSGSEDTPCPGSVPPFAPTITAGTLTNHAGTFSPLYVDLSRTDAMQYIASYSTVLPLGLTADLTGIPQCPQANIETARERTGTQEQQSPSCPETSLIGHSLVGTGAGVILDYVPGKLYLAGPFRGDPLSVVSITSAVVGPFDLGSVVVRFGLHIDPYTAQVSIDPSGSEPIPTIIDGIVTHIRDIRVSIDRSGFTINPTSCQPRPITSTLTSNLDQTARTSALLMAEACNELAFKPKFTAHTTAKTTRTNGASLSVKLTMPVKLGTQANIRAVKVDLPKQLPSRLTTLQQACTEAQFNTNPAGCPTASFIGTAKALTPILPVPLTGPAIFVSHGGEAFPSLILVLQGYGITIDLVGSTFITPKGITSTTFKTIPDEPVGSFELTLPQGKDSVLAANTNLCKQKLVMATMFLAQNGASTHQNTRITVTGCPTSLSLKHNINKQTLTLTIYTPTAGKLTANGKDLTKPTKTTQGPEDVTLTLKQKKTGKLKTTVRMIFTPSTGKDRKRVIKTLKVAFKE
jgi:hypothetical protein